MRKFIYTALFLSVLVPSVAGAALVQWDRNGSTQTIVPQFINDLVKGRLFQATSTSEASIFPYASTTALSATSLCLTSDCRTSWPVPGTGTVTQIDTTYPILGGPITTTGTLSFPSTSTPSVTSPITYSGTLGELIGGSSGSFGCATCVTEATASSTIPGTTGQVVYMQGTDDPIGTSTIFIATSEDVGIGTSIPSNYAGYKTLTINGTDGGEIDFRAGDVGAAYIWSMDNDLLFNAENDVYVTGSNFGISTSSPATNFAVSGNGYFTGGLGVGMVNTAAGTFKLLNTGFIEFASDAGRNIEIKGENPYYDFSSGQSVDYDWRIQQTTASNRYSISASSTANILNILGSGNVGIATTSPFAKLSVAGDAYIGGNLTATGTVQFTGLTSGLLYADSTGTLSSVATSTWTFASSTLLSDDNTFSGYDRFRTSVDSTTGFQILDADGGIPILNVDTTNERVGVGTSTPTQVLEVQGRTDNNAIGPLKITSDGAGLVGTALSVDSRALTGGKNWSFISTGSSASVGAGRFAFYQSGSGYKMTLGTSGGVIVGAHTFATDAPTGDLLVSGSIGVGQTSPSSRVQIGGTTADTLNRIILGEYTEASQAVLPVIQQVSVLSAGTGQDLALGARSGSGGIVFYTGSVGTSAQNAALGINSNTIRMAITSGGLVGIGTTTPLYKLSVEYTSDGDMFQLYDTDGNCLMNPESGGITTTCTSDENLKKNIRPSSINALGYLSEFTIRDYETRESNETHTGVVAQELELTHPELVRDIPITPSEDSNGIPVATTTQKFVSLPSIWVLVKAIQELFTGHNEQEARIRALEARIEELESKLKI